MADIKGNKPPDIQVGELITAEFLNRSKNGRPSLGGSANTKITNYGSGVNIFNTRDKSQVMYGMVSSDMAWSDSYVLVNPVKYYYDPTNSDVTYKEVYTGVVQKVFLTELSSTSDIVTSDITGTTDYKYKASDIICYNLTTFGGSNRFGVVNTDRKSSFIGRVTEAGIANEGVGVTYDYVVWDGTQYISTGETEYTATTNMKTSFYPEVSDIIHVTKSQAGGILEEWTTDRGGLLLGKVTARTSGTTATVNLCDINGSVVSTSDITVGLQSPTFPTGSAVAVNTVIPFAKYTSGYLCFGTPKKVVEGIRISDVKLLQDVYLSWGAFQSTTVSDVINTMSDCTV